MGPAALIGVLLALAGLVAPVGQPGLGAGTAWARPAGATASPGCGKRPVPAATATATGDVVQSLTVGGVVRSYRLAVPSRYRSSVATPLILLFHGSGSNALQASVYTQMPLRASRLGYLVATPDGQNGQWQLSPPGARTSDLEYVSALIAALSSRYCVDRSRVYAAGISLGSEFSAIVACTPSDHIAAVGLVAAEFLLRPCTGPIPVIAFHGTADPVVAYGPGGTGAALPGVHVVGVLENLAHWARMDGCRPEPRQVRPAGTVVLRSWSGCRLGSAVVLYSVLGGGHTWPGSPITISAAAFGATTHRIDASGLMLAFFDRHRYER